MILNVIKAIYKYREEMIMKLSEYFQFIEQM